MNAPKIAGKIIYEPIPFKKWHLEFLLEQKMNASFKHEFTPDILQYAEDCGEYFTLLADEPLVCGGVKKVWNGRGNIWCVFNENSKVNFVPVFRAIEKYVANQKTKYNRIDFPVPFGFENGIRRARLLGFEIEVECSKKFLPDGSDATIMAWVKGE